MSYSRDADSAKDIIDSLVSKIQDLEQQIEEDNAEYLRNQIEDLESEIESYKETIDDLTSEIAELKEQLNKGLLL